MIDDAGGRFAIDPTTGVVTVANGGALDYETKTSHTIIVQVTDGAGGNSTQSFTIAVTNVVPSQPTDSNAATNEVVKGAASGTLVGITAAAQDPNGPNVTFSLTDDAGGRFVIDPATGIVTVSNGSLLDYEIAASHSIVVRVSDGAGGESSQVFTINVLPIPAVASVSPGVGPLVGGTTVTITGVHLAGITAVYFGGTAASFVVNSDTSITAASPTGTAGPVDITIVAPGGTSATTPADQFTYVVVPVVASVSPAVGGLLGRDTVTITGTGFLTVTSVTFGDTPASFTVNSDTSITAVSPAGMPGIVDVVVSSPGGTSASTSADQFIYYDPTTPNEVPAKVTGITSTTTDGKYRVGATINVTINFDKPVTLSTGALTLILDNGGSVTIPAFSNATHVSGTYTVVAGQNSQSLDSTGLTVNGGAVRDALGQAVTLQIPAGHSLSNSSKIVVDTAPPSVTISSPSTATTTSGLISYTVLYSDANFNTSTLTVADITLNRTGTANGTVSVSNGVGLSQTVTISNITGTGTLGISLAAGTASDTAGNLAPAIGPSLDVSVGEVPASAAVFAVGGTDGTVRLLTGTGELLSSVTPISGYKGLVSVALGDFNGDTIPDLAVAAANASGVRSLAASDAGKVYVYDGVALASGTLTLLHTFTPFATHDAGTPSTQPYTNGLNIALGDVDSDGHVDLIAGTRSGNGTTSGQIEIGRLVVIDGTSPAGTNTVIGGIQKPFGTGYQKGVMLAAGNVDGFGGDEIAVTRGGPVNSPNPAVQQIKVKVLQLHGTVLTELPLNVDGTTAFAPFAGLAGAAKGIKRDGRVTFVDSNGDGKDELVFSALDPLTNPTNEQVRVGVYLIDPTASNDAATIASTGPDAGTYLIGTAVKDHAITGVAATGATQNIALLTENSSSEIVYLAPLTGAVQPGDFSLNVLTGGITLDGI